jgi:large subunit ribosomal protein L13
MGGQKERTAAEVRERHPRELVERAVWGMLPKGRLGRSQFRKLKVYAGPEHPHASQKPETMTMG